MCGHGCLEYTNVQSCQFLPPFQWYIGAGVQRERCFNSFIRWHLWRKLKNTAVSLHMILTSCTPLPALMWSFVFFFWVVVPVVQENTATSPAHAQALLWTVTGPLCIVLVNIMMATLESVLLFLQVFFIVFIFHIVSHITALTQGNEITLVAFPVFSSSSWGISILSYWPCWLLWEISWPCLF